MASRRQELLRMAWEQGALAYKLRPHQLPIYQAIQDFAKNPQSTYFGISVARQTGKTYVLLLDACEQAIRKPRTQLRMVTTTREDLKKIVNPIMDAILEDCPGPEDEPNLRPHWGQVDACYTWPNGSQLHLAGTDNGNAEKLRGPMSHRLYVDEAGSCDDLSYIVKSILFPQTLTTKGKIILASTPPRTPAHDWRDIYQECELDKAAVSFTIYDNPTLTPEDIERVIKASGGRESTHFRREYLVEWVVDEEYALVKEWKEDYGKQEILHDEYFPYYHRYTALDIGYKDLTSLIFGYYDFRKATLFIEDEAELQGTNCTTKAIAELTRKKEKERWGDLPVSRRIADNNNPILLNDMIAGENLSFQGTDKERGAHQGEGIEAMLNKVRLMVAEGRVRVHPRCVKTIGGLKYGVWNKSRKAFDHSKIYGHYDHLAALMYLIRNLDEYTNPIPPSHNVSVYKQWVQTPQINSEHEELRKLFVPKVKRIGR